MLEGSGTPTQHSKSSAGGCCRTTVLCSDRAMLWGLLRAGGGMLFGYGGIKEVQREALGLQL